MAANIAMGVATTVLPYVAQGVVGWVSNAAKTWVPAAVANHTIESASLAGAKMFGGVRNAFRPYWWCSWTCFWLGGSTLCSSGTANTKYREYRGNTRCYCCWSFD